MPDDIPKAVMVLVWLLIGIILFGWLLLEYTVLFSFSFLLLFFGLPILVYQMFIKDN